MLLCLAPKMKGMTFGIPGDFRSSSVNCQGRRSGMVSVSVESHVWSLSQT